MTDDEIAESNYARELRLIDDEIRYYEGLIYQLHRRRESLVTGKNDFLAYVKANRHYQPYKPPA